MFWPRRKLGARGSGTAGRALRRGGPGDAGGGRQAGAGGSRPGVLARGLVRSERGEGAVSSKERTGKRMGDGEGEKRKVIKKTPELQSIKLLA